MLKINQQRESFALQYIPVCFTKYQHDSYDEKSKLQNKESKALEMPQRKVVVTYLFIAIYWEYLLGAKSKIEKCQSS